MGEADIQGNTPDIHLNLPDIQVNGPSAHLNIPSTPLNIPAAHLNPRPIQVNIPSAQVNCRTIQVNSPPAHLNSPDIQVNIPSAQVNIRLTHLNIPRPQVNEQSPQGSQPLIPGSDPRRSALQRSSRFIHPRNSALLPLRLPATITIPINPITPGSGTTPNGLYEIPSTHTVPEKFVPPLVAAALLK